METHHVTQTVRKLFNISGMPQRTAVCNTPNLAERHRGLPYMGQIEICPPWRNWAAENVPFWAGIRIVTNNHK